MSPSELAVSRMSHSRSKRLRRAAGRLMFSCGVADIVGRPDGGQTTDGEAGKDMEGGGGAGRKERGDAREFG